MDLKSRSHISENVYLMVKKFNKIKIPTTKIRSSLKDHIYEPYYRTTPSKLCINSRTSFTRPLFSNNQI